MSGLQVSYVLLVGLVLKENLNIQTQQHLRERADEYAFPMFGLSVVFLLLMAGIIVTWIDIPRVAELAQLDADEKTLNPLAIQEAVQMADSASRVGTYLLAALLIMWPLFWLEFAYNYVTTRNSDGSRKTHLQPLLACLIPPLRIGRVSPVWDNRMWLPSLSWQHPGRELSSLLTRIFSKPMLVIALLILPILAIEFIFKGAIQQYFWLRLLLHIATGFIWFAFALEFIIMISATEKKLAYIKKNWIDLAIILIPLVSFLRTLRVLRIAKLAKIQKIARLGRVYRVRSLGTKALRAIMMFGFVNRLLRITPQKRLNKLREQHHERMQELTELEEEIAAVEQDIANTQKDC